MKKIAKKILLSLVMIALLIPSNISNAYWNGNFHKETDDIYYMAGVMNYSIWKYNNGTWQNGISPQSSNVDMDAKYSFTVPDRKIIGVTMEKLDSSNPIHLDTWNDTRSNEDINDLKINACYVKDVTENPSWSGKGTSTANVNIELTLDLTKNYSQTGVPSPKNERKEWQGENVEGFTYDVPVIFKIELEPLETIEEQFNVINMFIDQTTGKEIAPTEYFMDLEPGTYYYDAKDIPGFVFNYTEVETPDGNIKRYRIKKIKVMITEDGKVLVEPVLEE